MENTEYLTPKQVAYTLQERYNLPVSEDTAMRIIKKSDLIKAIRLHPRGRVYVEKNSVNQYMSETFFF